jgi:hypothetical protein
MALARLRRDYVEGTTFQMGNPGWIIIHVAAVIGLIWLGMVLGGQKETDRLDEEA